MPYCWPHSFIQISIKHLHMPGADWALGTLGSTDTMGCAPGSYGGVGDMAVNCAQIDVQLLILISCLKERHKV